MTSQDDRRSMEAMLASIREAIHRETALQLAGLHRAGDHVVVDHEPLSSGAASAVADGAEDPPPAYLRPLKEKAEDDLMSPPDLSGDKGPAAVQPAGESAEHETAAGETERRPLRLAAGAETNVAASGSIEDLFEAESERPGQARRPQARRADSLFEDILAGRHPVGHIVPGRSTDMPVSQRGGTGGWQEPARHSVKPVSESSSPAAGVSEGEAKKETSALGVQALHEGAVPSEKEPAVATDDPLKEIDLDDDVIWTVPEAAAPAHESRAAEMPAEASGKADDPADNGDRVAADGMEESALVAPEVAERVAEAFGRLDAEMILEALGGRAALERMVRQEMRPLLREWLNAHLPALVERIIREEIQRIIHGGRTPRGL